MSLNPATGEQLLGALERTLGLGSARIEFRAELSFPEGPLLEPPPTRPGGSTWRRLSRWMASVSIRVLNWGIRRLWQRATSAHAAGAPGMIDFDAHRCMHQLGRGSAKAELTVGDQRWHGAFGAAVESLTAGPASAGQPLWLIDLIRGVVDAREQPGESIDGRPTRYLSADADLSRAAEALSYQMAALPNIYQEPDRKHVPVEVWIDHQGYIRRIRHTRGNPHAGISTRRLDLIEFGIPIPADWSQIPALPA